MAFNSLFEMHPVYGEDAVLRRYGKLSILYLRCTGPTARRWMSHMLQSFQFSI